MMRRILLMPLLLIWGCAADSCEGGKECEAFDKSRDIARWHLFPELDSVYTFSSDTSEIVLTKERSVYPEWPWSRIDHPDYSPVSDHGFVADPGNAPKNTMPFDIIMGHTMRVEIRSMQQLSYLVGLILRSKEIHFIDDRLEVLNTIKN